VFIYLSNTNLLQLNGLKNESTDAVIAGAAVTVSIANKAGTPLAGMAWPQAMADVGSGNYELSIPPAVAWVVDTEYVATIDAVAVAGVGHWELHFKSRRRTTS
jgi:hypothetical protein